VKITWKKIVFTSIAYEIATENLEHRRNISPQILQKLCKKRLFLKKYYELRNQFPN